MRNLILVFSIFLVQTCFAQTGNASLKFSAECNETNNLKDNISNCITEVRISSYDGKYEKKVTFTPEINQLNQLDPGLYRLQCICNGREVIIENFIIRSEFITFVTVLFEPEKELTKREKRIRKKMYDNF